MKCIFELVIFTKHAMAIKNDMQEKFNFGELNVNKYLYVIKEKKISFFRIKSDR